MSQTTETEVLATLLRPTIQSQSPLDFIQSGSNPNPSPLDFIQADTSSESLLPSKYLSSPLDFIQVVSPLDFVQSQYRQYSADAPGGRGYSILSPTYSPIPSLPSQYLLPGYGRITSGFGYRPSFGRMHKGIDIAMQVGDTVRLPMPGRVMKIAYEAKGYGNYVTVSHANGMETRYAHLSQTLVYPGQHLAAGEPIALSGNTGNSTGPHLHFETRYMGTAIDPTTVFDFHGRNVSPRALYATSSAEPENSLTALIDKINPAGKNAPAPRRRTYIVRQGDTLKKIAEREGINLYRLCQLNFLTENAPLQTGRMLKLQ